MDPAAVRAVLQDRLKAIEERIDAACARAGRARSEVTLVAVTKTASIETARLLPDLGVVDLGESRPQELWRKAAVLPPTIRWHQVGHLQRNKIDRTLPLVHLIHSVDSVRLLKALDDESAKRNQAVGVLLEVNASREAKKNGFAAEELPAAAAQVGSLRCVQVRGLMTMAALGADAEAARPTFALLRQLRDRLRNEFPKPHDLQELSMGMTADFETAIEEGATLVRIGTALFEGVPRE